MLNSDDFFEFINGRNDANYTVNAVLLFELCRVNSLNSCSGVSDSNSFQSGCFLCLAHKSQHAFEIADNAKCKIPLCGPSTYGIIKNHARGSIDTWF